MAAIDASGDFPHLSIPQIIPHSASFSASHIPQNTRGRHSASAIRIPQSILAPNGRWQLATQVGIMRTRSASLVSNLPVRQSAGLQVRRSAFYPCPLSYFHVIMYNAENINYRLKEFPSCLNEHVTYRPKRPWSLNDERKFRKHFYNAQIKILHSYYTTTLTTFVAYGNKSVKSK